MNKCGACGGGGQDRGCSRAANCLTCGGSGYITRSVACVPVDEIREAIGILKGTGYPMLADTLDDWLENM